MTAERKGNRGPTAGPANRRALIAAARDVFAADGYRAPLSAVAKRAGVGQGSLYRHFPTRAALAVAVFDENITALEALAADPALGLPELIAGLVDQTVASTAFIDMVTAHTDDPSVAHLRDRMRDLAAAALARERAAGRVGPEVGDDDLVLALSMIALAVARAEPDDRRATAERAWQLLAPGLGVAGP